MKIDVRIKSEKGFMMLNKVREICQVLPEVEEKLDGFGCTAFRVHKKSFIRISETENGIRLSFKSNHENQDILIQGTRYIKAPYVGHRGWISIKENASIDWKELEILLKEAYLRSAPQLLVKKFLNR